MTIWSVHRAPGALPGVLGLGAGWVAADYRACEGNGARRDLPARLGLGVPVAVRVLLAQGARRVSLVRMV